MRCPDCGNLELPDVGRCSKCGRSLLAEPKDPAIAAPSAPEKPRAETGDGARKRQAGRTRRAEPVPANPAPERPPTAATRSWPKCQWHPDRPTKDKCVTCGVPVCAMCARSRFSDVYCKDCFGKSSAAFPGAQSGKFSGLSASYFETVKEVMFSPGSFFRNLPSRGSVFRIFLFGLINWFIGSVGFLTLLWLVALRSPGTDVNNVHKVVILPVLYGAVLASIALSLLGWVPYHLAAIALGGKGSAVKSFKMFNLCSAVCLAVMVPPLAGTPFALVLAASSLFKAVGEVHELDLPAAFAAFLASTLILLGGILAFSFYYLFQTPESLLF